MTLATTKNKGGRPKAVHHPKTGGDPIVGLYRLNDGRWRISGAEKITFTEPDEGRAIAKFHAIKAERDGTAHTMIEVTSGRVHDVAPKIRTAFRRPQVIEITIPRDADRPVIVSRNFDTVEAWAWFADQIIANPKYAAQRTGIEQLAYLPKLTKPVPSPKLADVGSLYTSRTDITTKEAIRCKGVWEGFCRAVGGERLEDLTPEGVAQWGLKVRSRGYTPKSVAHIFNRVRVILNYYRTTGIAIDQVRRALDCCAVLKAPEATSLDPHPISRANFHKLLNAVEGERKAMLLVALNCCFYGTDIIRLKWSQLDLERGFYHAKRGKTRVARCAVLWPRTIEALKAVPRGEDELVFHNPTTGRPHTIDTFRKAFARLRVKADVAKEVQFADIRDGSFTEAAAGEGVEFQHAQVLAGHRSGIADAYVLRKPGMVAKACAAVEAAYFG